MKTLNDDQITLVVETLRNSLQDTLDYAVPNDYEPGELEVSFGQRLDLLRELGGTPAGLSGKNSHLLDDNERTTAIVLADYAACVEPPPHQGVTHGLCPTCGHYGDDCKGAK
jgi:hypothetical protein